jgi:hypothetical protein
MSGGAHEYFCFKLRAHTEFLEEYTNGSARREKLVRLLYYVAEALHDIEWVDSGDKLPGDENIAIDKVFQFIIDKQKEDSK